MKTASTKTALCRNTRRLLQSSINDTERRQRTRPRPSCTSLLYNPLDKELPSVHLRRRSPCRKLAVCLAASGSPGVPNLLFGYLVPCCHPLLMKSSSRGVHKASSITTGRICSAPFLLVVSRFLCASLFLQLKLSEILQDFGFVTVNSWRTSNPRKPETLQNNFRGKRGFAFPLLAARPQAAERTAGTELV